MILLAPYDLMLAAGLVIALAGLSWRMTLGLERRIAVASLRSAVQLFLVGFVLKIVFENATFAWVGTIAGGMILLAGWEVGSRQKRPLKGVWGYGTATLSLFVSSVAVILFTLFAIVGAEPWYRPQYAIPLLGMLLGNSMNGIALGVDRLTTTAYDQRASIEGRLLLGEEGRAAIADIRKESVRVGLIPILNAMAAAGIISLPGMMTGQILAGSPPAEAVKYQILVMFLIASVTGFGTVAAVSIVSRRLFDRRQRLRLDRLR